MGYGGPYSCVVRCNGAGIVPDVPHVVVIVSPASTVGTSLVMFVLWAKWHPTLACGTYSRQRTARMDSNIMATQHDVVVGIEKAANQVAMPCMVDNG